MLDIEKRGGLRSGMGLGLWALFDLIVEACVRKCFFGAIPCLSCVQCRPFPVVPRGSLELSFKSGQVVGSCSHAGFIG